MTLQNEFQTLHEIVRAARATLDKNLWDYVVGGAGTETTLLRNRVALDRIGFRPRVLVDVSRIDPSATLFGHRIRIPAMLAPVGGLDQLGDGGGATIARGAGMAGVPFLMSSVTELTLETVAAAASGPKIFQLYVRGDAAWVDDHITRAVAAGYDAFCITVDSALYSRRERDMDNRFAKPWRAAATSDYQAALNWSDIARIRDRHEVPLILKGIATAEDALRALELGVAGIYVSNHGGRQLDHGAGAIEVLPEIVDAVAGRALVMVDGGFSRGTDIVKAIALGADCVGVGRLYVYGYAAAGAEGIARVIELLEDEVRECLGLLGLASFAGLDASYLRPVEAMVTPHVHSAFPLLERATGASKAGGRSFRPPTGPRGMEPSLPNTATRGAQAMVCSVRFEDGQFSVKTFCPPGPALVGNQQVDEVVGGGLRGRAPRRVEIFHFSPDAEKMRQI
jgi:glycolate oxidase